MRLGNPIIVRNENAITAKTGISFIKSKDCPSAGKVISTLFWNICGILYLTRYHTYNLISEIVKKTPTFTGKNVSTKD